MLGASRISFHGALYVHDEGDPAEAHQGADTASKITSGRRPSIRNKLSVIRRCSTRPQLGMRGRAGASGSGGRRRTPLEGSDIRPEPIVFDHRLCGSTRPSTGARRR